MGLLVALGVGLFMGFECNWVGSKRLVSNWVQI